MLNQLSLISTLAKFGIEAGAIKDIQTQQLVNDTRLVKQGDIFCAVIGGSVDGKKFINKAIEAGAVAVIAECEQQAQHGEINWQAGSKVPVTSFYQLNFHLFELAKAYYQAPQDKLSIVGITGTNGKTSTSQIIAKLLEAYGQPCAVIGTTGAGKVDDLQPLENTTPSASLLHQLFAGFQSDNISNVAMEVSSHALAQRRITADLVDIAVFTNLSRDHLDYHQTMANYANAKFALFKGQTEQVAIINADDDYGKKWLASGEITEQVIAFGRDFLTAEFQCFVKANNIGHRRAGVKFTLSTHLGEIDIQSQLMGDFNIDNLLAAIAVLIAKDIPLAAIANAVTKVTPIIGRMESFSAPNKATTIVDYAHTPDALANAIIACKQHTKGEVWVVFGCGGDRDKGKRSLMGAAAENNADQIIVANDNPRTEAPEQIAKDILAGCKYPEKIKVLLDRAEATKYALEQAKADDMVLFAGKGHEDYVVIGIEKIPYNEREIIQQYYDSEAVS